MSEYMNSAGTDENVLASNSLYQLPVGYVCVRPFFSCYLCNHSTLQLRKLKQTETHRMLLFVFFLQLDTERMWFHFLQSLDGLLEPCVCILRKLVYADSSLRHSLTQHNLLLTMLRGNRAR